MSDWDDIRRGRIGVDLLAAEREARVRVGAELLTLVERGGGGVTLDRAGHPVYPTSGYAVGITAGTAAIVRDLDPYAVAEAVRAVRRLYSGADYFGLWLSDGALHIDPVAIVGTFHDAAILGKHHGQLAVFAFEDLKDCPL